MMYDIHSISKKMMESALTLFKPSKAELARRAEAEKAAKKQSAKEKREREKGAEKMEKVLEARLKAAMEDSPRGKGKRRAARR